MERGARAPLEQHGIAEAQTWLWSESVVDALLSSLTHVNSAFLYTQSRLLMSGLFQN